jgi:16S rRNA G966 N2-methylase RsmD
MSMPRPPTAHRHPHSNARQFDLFCDPPYAAAQTPQWQALPAETRQTLTKLLVRLIFGHADGDLVREREEMRHDV